MIRLNILEYTGIVGVVLVTLKASLTHNTKPMQYMLRTSTYANQLAACNQAGECFVTNDGPNEFVGAVQLRLLNVQTGVSVPVREGAMPVSVPAGAGAIDWFCAAPPLVAGPPPMTALIFSEGNPSGDYVYYPCQVPLDDGRFNIVRNLTMTLDQCQTECDASTTCAGFSRVSSGGLPMGAGCSLYFSQDDAQKAWLRTVPGGGAGWWQKPNVPAFPVFGPPVFPTCVVPTPMQCPKWAAIPQWEDAGCLSGGENCVIELVVTSAGGKNKTALPRSEGPPPPSVVVVSRNIQPFVPPKRMQLSSWTPPTVTVAVGRVFGDNQIQLLVHSPGVAAALYVVLTTVAEGRFSDNAFLLEGSVKKEMWFVSWKPVTDSVVDLLRSSLRVEHLAEHL